MSGDPGSPERSTNRVLKAARVDDELGIAQRRSDAEDLLDHARQSAAQMLARSREQGLEEGISTVMRTTLEEVRRIIQDFSHLVQEREVAIVDIVMNAVEKIIGQSPPREQARLVLSTALDEMLESFTVVLKVAAEDLGMVRALLAELQAGQRGQNIVSVLVDPLLSAGEMLLETEKGRVHIGLGQQFSRLRAGLHQAAHPRA